MPEGGWGMTSILEELLSREPAKLPTDDLGKLQSNLQREGYLAPDHPATGMWDAESSAAFSKFERDAESMARSGVGWDSAPVDAVLRFMSNTIPSSVWTGTIGAAKGIAAQTGESAERLGLAGGAVAGAAIGTAIAPGIGTAIGAGLGAVGGFFADLIGKDEGEDAGESSFIDALSPLEEWAGTDANQYQGPKAFFEDLGYVASAAMLIRGAGMGIGAARAGASSLSKMSLQEALKTPATSAPGLLAKGVAKVLPEKAAGAWTQFMTKNGLNAISNKPLVAAVNKTFTGFASGQLGARYAAGMGQGEDTSTIEDYIGAEKAPGFMSAVDWSLGMVVYPNRFLPFEKGTVAKSAQSLLATPLGKPLFRMGKDVQSYLNNGVAMRPYLHLATKRGVKGSIRDRIAESRRFLGETEVDQIKADGWLRLDFGAKSRAEEIVVFEKGLSRSDPGFNEALQNEVFNLKRTIREEAELGPSATAKDLVARSYAITADSGQVYDTSMQFARFLEDLEGQGSGLDKMSDFIWANRRTQQLMNDGLAVQLAADEATFGAPLRSADRIKAEGRIKFLQDKIAEAERQLDETANITQMESLQVQIQALKDEAAELSKVKGLPEPDAEWVAVPSRLETPTRQSLLKDAERIETLAGQRKMAMNAARKAEDNLAGQPDMTSRTLAMNAEDEMRALTEDLWKREIIPDGMEQAAPDKIAEHLRQRAEGAPRELNVPQSIADEYATKGYKLVGARDGVFYMDEVPSFIGKHDLGDYTKRAAFFETIGMSPYRFKDQDIAGLRGAHDQAEVAQVLAESGIEIPAKVAFQRLQKKLNAMRTPIEEGGEVKNVSKLQRVTRKTQAGEVNEYGLRVERRQLSVDDIVDALRLDDYDHVIDPHEVGAKVQAALKRGGAFGAETSLKEPIQAARMLGKALRANGLPGFSDFMRTFEFASPTRPIIGATTVVGAGAGYEEGGLKGALVGGATGAIGGIGLGAFVKQNAKLMNGISKKSYLYLPDKLHNLNMLLRYSLSPTFDMGRYVEQYTLGKAKGDLPFIARPEQYLDRKYGVGAYDEASKYWDNLNGNNMTVLGDDLERRLNTVGMVGFNPRKMEAAQAFLLSKRVDSNGRRIFTDDQIFEKVAEIGRYGLGRTSGEKTVNFVFFPFSFQKKLLTSLGDFVTQAPARNLLLHEGLRRYYQASEDGSLSEQINEFVDKHLPVIESLKYLNNLSQGASPGRFILQGVANNDTDAGTAAQILSSVFVPSGAATPVAQTAAGLTDAAIHLFVPVVVAGESYEDGDAITELVGEIDRYIPLYRDVQKYWEALGDQKTAVLEGEAPYSQLTSYFEEKREKKAELEPIALAMGFDDVDNFLRSDAGAVFRLDIEQQDFELGMKYPTGKRMSAEFTDIEKVNEQLIHNLAEKTNRTKSEDEILSVYEMQESAKNIAPYLNMNQEQALAVFAPGIRKKALANFSDPRFRELWNRLFAWQFGPLEQAAAGKELLNA